MPITTKARGPGAGGRTSTEICAELRSEVVSGKFAPGQYLPTERQLSARYEVAQNTVRRALKALEAEKLIAAEPRQGYRVLARANDPERGCPLAFVNWNSAPAESWSNIDAELLRELQLAADERGWPLLSMAAGELAPEQVLERLGTARSFGVLTSTLDAQTLDAIRGTGLPVLMLDQWIEGSGLDSIMQDGHQGGILAARHLVAAGCKRIAWFGWISPNAHSMARFGGVSAGLTGEGRPLTPELTFNAGPGEDLAVARRMLKGKGRPDGIIALWQGSCAAIKQAADELGLAIGRDFQLVGWSMEETFESRYSKIFGSGPVPPTITWSVRTMARTAVARLAQRRDDPDMPALQIRIPVRLRLTE
ncbi:MAG TPA: GntR family transcriptional regulator [Planctomycetota bacterium]|nr:GntR family transcriptional regulator [Planctomycetota bacterium]